MKAFTVFVLLCVVSGAHSSSRDESCSNHDKAMDDALKTVCAKTCMRWSVVNSYDMTDGIGQVLNSATHNRCGSSEGIVTINELQIDPSPLVLPGNINLAFKVNVKRDLQSPIKVEVTVWKSILIWIHVKDFAFEDVCEFLTDGKCPQSFIDNNIPCSCPIPEVSTVIFHFIFSKLNYIYCRPVLVQVGWLVGCLTPHSAIFQLYDGGL
ncbi:uncharacterized protein LOC124124671 isoform X1 [Haliotis rufescens]|uniref:uncharacterized protein LOC124124671 isoform X1 n=1 Tax=Haliotis rufescens TaxID=6454 RepID=UPI00201F9E61|nr:uncharacterized protein LOC124124671 isoform X1 [Haliotis rufescens]